MIISANLLSLLRCPRTGQKLLLADAELMARANAAMSVRKEELPENLRLVKTPNVTVAVMSLDRRTLYPVRNGIPILLSEEAVIL